jgi:hypothetical protein
VAKVPGITGTGTGTGIRTVLVPVAILCNETLNVCNGTVPGITGSGTYIPVLLTDPNWI